MTNRKKWFILKGSPSEKYFQDPEPTDSNKDDKYADEKPERDEMMVGNFYDGNGSKTWMDIVKQDDGTYYISITTQVNMGTYYGYGLIGTLSGDTITYSGGAKSELVYDENGNITSNLILEQDHTGSITHTNTGFVWQDSDGSRYVFVNSMMAAYWYLSADHNYSFFKLRLCGFAQTEFPIISAFFVKNHRRELGRY